MFVTVSMKVEKNVCFQITKMGPNEIYSLLSSCRPLLCQENTDQSLSFNRIKGKTKEELVF